MSKTLTAKMVRELTRMSASSSTPVRLLVDEDYSFRPACISDRRRRSSVVSKSHALLTQPASKTFSVRMAFAD